MDVGSRIWCKDKATNDWLTGVIQSKDSIQIVIRIDEGKIINYPTALNKELIDVQPMNNKDSAEVENLIHLTYLNEPSILHCLEHRFKLNLIYTFTGPFLIAMNPFESLEIYSSEVLDMYENYGRIRSQGLADQMRLRPLPPHVYSVADNAYRDMIIALQRNFAGSSDKVLANQSILISGESGAGKTETTKHILRYLTKVSGDSSLCSSRSKAVMDKLLQSNPILESFGNARTLRNDNSSRFGKFMLLQFNESGALISGTIRTYLLEKVRICTQQAGERNYHAFYQLLAGVVTPEEKKRYGLTTLNVKNFHFINQGNCFEVSRLDDKSDFASLERAFRSLRFESEDQQLVFDLLAGMLHLGQMLFTADDSDGSFLKNDPAILTSVSCVALLFGVDSGELQNALTKRTVKTSYDTFIKPLTASQATDTRDSIAKAVYSRLFDHIVNKINDEVRGTELAELSADIGVLDIFGFESFKTNSLEQLCINYANEALQQLFNEFVFINEQKEYKEEGIEWSFVDFKSNQDCLDMLDMKQKGIFAMIDEECMVPQGSDTKLAGRLYSAFQSFPRFAVSSSQKVQGLFCIKHYAGTVIYSTQHFLDKNKDEVPPDSFALFSRAKNPLLAALFQISTDTSKEKSKGTRFVSVTTQFKDQLQDLVRRIKASKPHYIRCIKSNERSEPACVNRVSVAEQLQYGGVIEAVRVARSGFPVRISHFDFLHRYGVLACPFKELNMNRKSNFSLSKTQSVSKQLCGDLIASITDERYPPVDQSNAKQRQLHMFVKMWKGNVAFDENTRNEMQLGNSKVFLQSKPYDNLEGRRMRLLSARCLVIQTRFRQHYAKKVTRAMKEQRSKLTSDAASFIQAVFKKYNERRKYLEFRKRIVNLQRALRRRRSYSARKEKIEEVLWTVELEEEMLEAELRHEYAIQLQFHMKKLLKIHRVNLFRQVVLLTILRLREIKQQETLLNRIKHKLL